MAFFRGGRGPFEGRGGRVRRGGIKFLVLETLLERPRHGYEVMEEFERRRGFRPSPGSIYPVLQMLEEGGYVMGSEVDGKRVYAITESGRGMYAQRAPESDGDDEPTARGTFRTAAVRLTTALGAARGASDGELAQIAAILDRARREILRLLASEEL